MASNKQRIAQQRNWLKLRVSSMCVYNNDHNNLFTQEEIEQLNIINNIRRRLINSWDENTKQIINNTENEV